jgi:hypothetical protein
MQQQYFD